MNWTPSDSKILRFKGHRQENEKKDLSAHPPPPLPVWERLFTKQYLIKDLYLEYYKEFLQTQEEEGNRPLFYMGTRFEYALPQTELGAQESWLGERKLKLQRNLHAPRKCQR